MSKNEPVKKAIKTYDGQLVVTSRMAKHPKKGEMVEYFSFSNGMDVCGIYVDEETKQALVDFLCDEEEGEEEDGE